MKRKSTNKEAVGSSADDLYDHRLTNAYASQKALRYLALETRAGARLALESGPDSACGERQRVTAPGTHSPRIGRPERILSPRDDRDADDISRRRELFPPEDDAQYHDNELGDVYDLYNACNGVMSGELLDVRKLEELTAQEREVLDVERLRKVWEHTATGCSTCAQIVRTLNHLRGKLKGTAPRPRAGTGQKK